MKETIATLIFFSAMHLQNFYDKCYIKCPFNTSSDITNT